MRSFVFLILILSVASTGLAAPQARTWTSGKFTIEATFVGFQDGKVRLDTGSKIVEIRESKLSAADQEYLSELRKQQQQAAARTGEVDAEIQSADALAAIKKYLAAAGELDDTHQQQRHRLEKKQQREQAELDAKQETERKRNRRTAILALQKSVDKAKQEGDLDDAVRIRDQIAQLKEGFSQAETGSTATNNDRRWPAQLQDLLGSWKWGARGMRDRVTFFEDGTATASWGGEGTWEKTPDRIVVKWHNNKTTYGSPKWDTINLPLDLDNVTGDSWIGPEMLRAEKIRE